MRQGVTLKLFPLSGQSVARYHMGCRVSLAETFTWKDENENIHSVAS